MQPKVSKHILHITVAGNFLGDFLIACIPNGRHLSFYFLACAYGDATKIVLLSVFNKSKSKTLFVNCESCVSL